MRYINIHNIELPNGWEKRANDLLTRLINATPPERKEIIKDNSDVWKALKEALGALSHGKCWYCEIKVIRSDNPIDHFRPKNRVADCEHEGYWWLAFDWHNYRFSCTYCNSRRIGIGGETTGGKQDYFPLVDENSRAKDHNYDIRLEQPLLLDPTISTDPDLLWFEIDGTPRPKFGKDQDEIKYKRATISIELYHLHEERLEEKRRELYQTLSRLVSRANEALDDAVQALNQLAKKRAKERYKKAIEEIREILSEKTELSSVAKIFLLTFSTLGTATQGRWINQLLSKLE